MGVHLGYDALKECNVGCLLTHEKFKWINEKVGAKIEFAPWNERKRRVKRGPSVTDGAEGASSN